jgi:hypothetical protein
MAKRSDHRLLVDGDKRGDREGPDEHLLSQGPHDASRERTRYELLTIDFAKGKHKQPAYLARQPFGQLPALDDGGFGLRQALIHDRERLLEAGARRLQPESPTITTSVIVGSSRQRRSEKGPSEGGRSTAPCR